MRKWIYQVLSYIFFLCIGLFLLYFAFKGQNVAGIFKRISNANVNWIIPVIMASFTSYFVRTIRWRMLIRASGYTSSIANTYHTLMFGYLVNLAIPRLGEISRCAALNKKERIPFNLLLGTVITERAIDIVMLGLLVIFTLAIKFDFLYSIITNHIVSPAYESIDLAVHSFMGLISLGAGILIMMVVSFYLYLYRSKISRKIPGLREFLYQLKAGLISITRIHSIGLFLLYTLVIWLMYFLTTYLLFFSLDATDNLGLMAGLVINVISNIARTMPIQAGGLGAYHFLVSQGLLLYDISAMESNIFATLNHGLQTLYPLAFGAISWVFLFFTRRKPEGEDSYEKDSENQD